MIAGTRRILPNEIPAIAAELGVTVEEILERITGRRGTVRMTMLVGTVGAGSEVYPVADFEPGNGLEEIPSAPGFPLAVGVRVQGNSMYPVYRDGDLIYFEKADHIPPNAINQECIVALDDGKVFIKVLRPSAVDKSLFDLESYNQPPIENQRVAWASPAIAVIRAPALRKIV